MLDVNNISVKYTNKKILSNINFSINESDVIGLIGPNGAGKSTLLKAILSFIPVCEGEIVFTSDIFSTNKYNYVGYLPEERGLDLKSTVQDQIIYFAELKGCKKKDIIPKIDYWLKELDVKGDRKDIIKKLSKGNQQKIQLICTFIHNPKFIILDEPFSGLDPSNIKILISIIKRLKTQGVGIIFSSHNMDSVEGLCNKILMLKKGEMILNNSVNNIKGNYEKLNVLVETSDATYLKNIKGVQNIKNLENDKWLISISDSSIGKVIFKEIADNEGYVSLFSHQPPTLYEIFNMEMESQNE
ncbi:ABC transporter ATP-binding protein [Carnobacterium gallinarum]|uniref:ABC transporter ATP-binding protein n=1 Tax=Carnobacterium gallinarum TaxID=2749 RepID=UPI000551EA3C|nr:ATP-binding cassette domain-containing protein [Carnobacterium gallinarum]